MGMGKLRTASESLEAAKIREAIGAGPEEDVDVVTPQFERGPGEPPPTAAHAIDFEQLRRFDREGLSALGCGQWNDPKEPDDEFAGKVLMLFPGEWYAMVPEGYEIVDIFNTVEKFQRGVTDDDIRFGCLSFGILVPE